MVFCISPNIENEDPNDLFWQVNTSVNKLNTYSNGNNASAKLLVLTLFTHSSIFVLVSLPNSHAKGIIVGLHLYLSQLLLIELIPTI